MTRFPNEIWMIVLRHLWEPPPSEDAYDLKVGFPCGIAALSRLCRVSKRLQRLAETLLYQALPPWKGHGDASRLPLLLRTLSARRDLAQNVRSLDYGTWLDCYANDRRDEDNSDFQLAPNDDVLSAFQDTSLRFSLDESRMVPSKEDLTCIGAALNSPGVSQFDAQLAMLLIMLPNLERLVMHLVIDEDILAIIQSWFIWHGAEVQNNIITSVGNVDLRHSTVPRTESESLAPLGHLQELHIRPRSYQYLSRQYRHYLTIYTPYLEPLLLHRGIATLRAGNVYFCSRWNGQPTWSAELWAVEKLAITRATLDGPGLSNIVSRCPNLRNLHIEFECPGMGMLSGEIGDIVRNHGKRLESLSLIHSTADDEGIGSLQTLCALRELAVTPATLLGQSVGARLVTTPSSTLADVLPTSLETLRLESQQLESWTGVAILESALYSLTSDDRFASLREIRWETGTGGTVQATTECVNHRKWKISNTMGCLALNKLG